MAIAQKAPRRENSSDSAADGGIIRLFTKPSALRPHHVAPGARAAMLTDRLFTFLLGAFTFQLVEIIRTWP